MIRHDIHRDGEASLHKKDVRLYTYDGAPLFAVARIYHRQPTNFRTPDEGFAPVLVL